MRTHRVKHTDDWKICEISSSHFLRACFLVYTFVLGGQLKSYFFKSHFGPFLLTFWGFFYVLGLHNTLINSINGHLIQIKLFWERYFDLKNHFLCSKVSFLLLVLVVNNCWLAADQVPLEVGQTKIEVYTKKLKNRLFFKGFAIAFALDISKRG